MPTLGQIIREIQREAAALPTDALRHEIEMNLDVQDAAIDQYYTIPPGGRTVEDLIIANSTVMVSVLTTALYVRELTTRPVVRSADGRHQSTTSPDETPRPGGVEVPLARLGLKGKPPITQATCPRGSCVMPSSNRGMFGRGNGTIAVIEQPVMRSYRRKAKIMFYVTWFIVTVLAATVAASKWHPVIALFAGASASASSPPPSSGPSSPPGRSSGPSGGGPPKPSSPAA